MPVFWLKELTPLEEGRSLRCEVPDYASGRRPNEQQFTSKERDNQTGLDYFGARYYASMQGRFTSVDPSRKSISTVNPQTWNQYTYALNNPLAYVDQNGKWPTEIHNLIIDRKEHKSGVRLAILRFC